MRYCGFGLGITGLPRGESLLDMHFAMKLLRAAPVSFLSSAPNLQVSIFCCGVAAKAGATEQERRGQSGRRNQSTRIMESPYARSAVSMSAM